MECSDIRLYTVEQYEEQYVFDRNIHFELNFDDQNVVVR